MNFKTYSNEDVLKRTEVSSRGELVGTTVFLWHLREVEERKLFAALGYSSLFEFVVKKLGRSPGAAWRRVNAMRVMKEIPEVEKMIQDCTVSLSTLSSVQSFCRKTKASLETKKQLIKQIENKSERETEKILAALNPKVARRERVRKIAVGLNEALINFTDEELAEVQAALNKHSHKAKDIKELLLFLVRKDNIAPKARNTQPKPPKSSTYIPRATKRFVLDRAKHQCEFTHAGRRCEAKRHLHIDHIHPRALGGLTAEKNLRVLCQAHNQYEAAQYFGAEKMEKHWAKAPPQ